MPTTAKMPVTMILPKLFIFCSGVLRLPAPEIGAGNSMTTLGWSYDREIPCRECRRARSEPDERLRRTRSTVRSAARCWYHPALAGRRRFQRHRQYPPQRYLERWLRRRAAVHSTVYCVRSHTCHSCNHVQGVCRDSPSDRTNSCGEP
jgi:hypothetical protein